MIETRCRRLLALVLVTLLAAGALPALAGGANEPPRGRAYSAHAPIVINADANFTAANGVTSGDGTLGNPYIIDGYQINGSASIVDGKGIGIDIVGTGKHVVIRNCLLTGDPADGANSYYGIRIMASNLTIENCMVHDNDWGIFGYCSLSTIRNNDVYHNGMGISVSGYPGYFIGTDNRVIGNRVYGNNDGISLACCEATLVENNDIHDHNTVSGEQGGLLLSGSANNSTVRGNSILRSETGIFILSSDGNDIHDNNLTDNIHAGIRISGSRNNRVHLNNLNNTLQAFDDGANNSWNSSEKGNWWSDYTGADANSDGIGDTPRDISAAPQDPTVTTHDHKPLMQPVGGAPPSNEAPVASIDSIAPNPADQGQPVTFTGHGTDSDGTVAGYEWRSDRDGALGDQATFTCSSLSAGIHMISFRVRDDDGAWSEHVTRPLVVIASSANQAPMASITSPANDSQVSGGVTISGTADDPDGSIQRVEVRLDEGNWTKAFGSRSPLAWNYFWDTTAVANGEHTVSARSYDGIDYSGIVWIKVTVNNTAPPVNLPPAAAVLSYSGLANTSVRLAWTRCAEPDFQNYSVYRSSDNATWELLLSAAGANETSLTVANLTPNTTYYFKVRVYDTEYLFNDSAILSVRTLSDQQPPANRRPQIISTSYSPRETRTGLPVKFTVEAEDSDGEVAFYFIDFGDGTDSGWVNNSTVEHRYTAAGNFTAKGRARDDKGAESDLAVIGAVKVTADKQEEETVKKGFLPSIGALGILAGLAAAVILLGRNRRS